MLKLNTKHIICEQGKRVMCSKKHCLNLKCVFTPDGDCFNKSVDKLLNIL
jgi:hypothetical protein